MKKILISIFNTLTQSEFLSSSLSYLGNTTKLNNCKKGDIIILQNIETKIVFGIAEIDEYDSGNVYIEHCMLDSDTYSGDAAKYNKYEIKIKNFKKVNITFEDISFICGKSLQDPSRTNIWKGSCFSFRKANYSGEDSDLVLKKLYVLLNSIVTSQ